ncbi:MAG: hypothetical protein KKE36_09500 [Actinobacteria bacterium]|nr:hypothetical protein [Actinomycetota bacterium]
MNRILIATITLVSCLALLASGCGGPQDQAKAYMQEGDAVIVKMAGQTPGFKKDLEDLFKGVFSGDGLEPAEFEQTATALRETANSIKSQGEEARASYAGIQKLSDVEDYKEYAALMVQALDVNEKGLNDLESFLDEAAGQVKAANFDAIVLANGIETFSDKAAQISDDLQKLQKQAADLKKEKGL